MYSKRMFQQDQARKLAKRASYFAKHEINIADRKPWGSGSLSGRIAGESVGFRRVAARLRRAHEGQQSSHAG